MKSPASNRSILDPLPPIGRLPWAVSLWLPNRRRRVPCATWRRRAARPATIGLAWALLLIAPFGSRAQDAPPVPAPAPAAEKANAELSAGPTTAPGPAGKKKPPGNLWELIVAGGPMNMGFMGFLGFFSLVAATVVLERLVNLTRRKTIPPDLRRGLEELVHKGEGRPESFRELCQRFPSPMASILKAGLLRVGRPPADVEKSMEDAAAREMANLRRRTRPLSVVASIAPLVGLLGTVVGMLEAFRVASQAGLGKAEVLAEGIYLALETTVAGLIIAIPALLFAALFTSRVERFMHEIDEHLMEAMPALARMGPAGDRGSVRPGSANPLL